MIDTSEFVQARAGGGRSRQVTKGSCKQNERGKANGWVSTLQSRPCSCSRRNYFTQYSKIKNPVHNDL
jgi:hypothetical protein